VSFDQKPYRRALMETYGARCVASPSIETGYGRAVLAKDPKHPGSLGIAISEAVEVAASRDDTKYALGSVLNNVLLHQTIVGQEAMQQMEMAGDDPDVIVGCTGGGSNSPASRSRSSGSSSEAAATAASWPSSRPPAYR
jgi:tryptophan synthase beta chain